MGTKYGTGRMTALEIIDRILNSQATVVYDQVTENGKDKAVVNKTETVAAQEKKAVIEAAFQNWIWADPERAERMMAIYNEKVNVYRRPTYNGSHLKLPGLSWGVPVAPYQLNAIWRTVQSQTMLFGHDVGLGKTRMAVISIMESIRLGQTRKAMVVCPNQTVGQWQAEVLAAYPTANVLCATPEDLAKFDRQEFMSRIATGAWDVVIVPMSSFKSLPVGPEVEERFIELQKAELEIFLNQLKEEGAGYRSRKIVEKALKNFEAKLDALCNMKKDWRRSSRGNSWAWNCWWWMNFSTKKIFSSPARSATWQEFRITRRSGRGTCSSRSDTCSITAAASSAQPPPRSPTVWRKSSSCRNISNTKSFKRWASANSITGPRPSPNL